MSTNNNYTSKYNKRNSNNPLNPSTAANRNKINTNNIRQNKNNTEIRKQSNTKNEINNQIEKCNIPDCIFELFIRIYYLNKYLRDMIKTKSDKSEDYYIVNHEFLKDIMNVYNYSEICKEIQKNKYKDELELELKINYLIKSIKQKGIINEKVPLDNVPIIPRIKSLFSQYHFVNFCLVNDKIIKTIQEIKKKYNLIYEVSSNKHPFYFKPQFFYTGKNPRFIKIGTLNNEDVFEMHYYISVDLTSSILTTLIYELRSSISVESFFKNRKIDIEKNTTHDLIDCFGKHGKVINFKYKKQDVNLNIIHNEKYENFTKTTFSDITKDSTEVGSIVDLSYLDKFNTKSFHDIKQTPMIGLQNIGQTCYMNAALQCFSNTKALTNYFLNYNNLNVLKANTIIINEINEPSLVIEYLKLIRHLWCDKPKSFYAPNDFKKAIGKIDSLFQNFEANDAKDFVNFMIMRMHEELNGVDNSLIKDNSLIEPQMPLNPYNQMQVLQSYLYDFQINFSSLISNCFYGTTQGEFECQNCKMKLYQTGQNMPLIKYNYQTFFFLNFPLAEVSKYILSNQMLYRKYMNANVNPNIAVDLMDCFSYYQKDEILGCYCDGCQNNNAQVVSRTKLYVAPVYLIILLNRGKGIEFNIKIMFPEFFDTKGIFINPTGVYQLYGVVKHFGESSSAGHFTAYCRSPIDNRWYFYNDATVTPVNEQEKYRIQEEGLTYMLFYSQMNNK